tara:strand:+ start:739 stop:1182 length:444 start_codon:yes stop_codon:yes gene_type:complete
MNKLSLNLNKREKKLVFVAIGLIALTLLVISISSFITEYNQTKFNFIKAKSDYEYVKQKVESVSKKKITELNDEAEINKFLSSNLPSNNYYNLKTSFIDGSVIVAFNVVKLEDGVDQVSEISNLLEKNVSNLSIQENDKGYSFTTSF